MRVCGFRRVGFARRRNVHSRGRRQIGRSRIDTGRRDGSGGCASVGNTVYAPRDICIGRIGDGRGKCLRISEQHRPTRGRDGHDDGLRRWWRRHRARASSAAAMKPRRGEERSEKIRSGGWSGHAVHSPIFWFALAVFCVRGRMHGGMQAKGQRNVGAGFWLKSANTSTHPLS